MVDGIYRGNYEASILIEKHQKMKFFFNDKRFKSVGIQKGFGRPCTLVKVSMQVQQIIPRDKHYVDLYCRRI